MSWVLPLTVSFGIGASIGYALCRHNLWCIAKDQLTAWEHARLFGYPYKKPTIQELEEILKQENK